MPKTLQDMKQRNPFGKTNGELMYEMIRARAIASLIFRIALAVAIIIVGFHFLTKYW